MIRSSLLRLIALAMPLSAAGCYIYTDDFPEPPGGPTSPPAPSAPSGGSYYPPGTIGPGTQRPDGAPGTEYPPGAGGDPVCPGRPVDRWKELLIVDPSVVLDSRARNEVASAPWSFRRRLEEVAGSSATAGDLAWTWLNSWRWSYSVAATPGIPGAPRVAVTPRPSIDDLLLCPWLRASPGNACTPTCTSCADRRLDLARAPFRLIAIVNRSDLGGRDESAGPVSPGALPGPGACGRDGGELRFIYTAIAPSTSLPLPFTVIFEHRVALPEGQDRRGWARAWRALGRLPFGPEYNARLDALISQRLRPGSLQRVQTNEIALGQPLGLPWEMRQFVPLAGERGGTVLEPTAAAHTPRLSLDGTPELATFLVDNRWAILEGDNLLSPDMLAGSALLDRADFRWQAPGADPAVLEAFNANTCNGCHGGRREAADLAFQHVGSPLGVGYASAPGRARVSSYLHDPAGGEDELARRGRLLEAAACSGCGGYPTP